MMGCQRFYGNWRYPRSIRGASHVEKSVKELLQTLSYGAKTSLLSARDFAPAPMLQSCQLQICYNVVADRVLMMSHGLVGFPSVIPMGSRYKSYRGCMGSLGAVGV